MSLNFKGWVISRLIMISFKIRVILSTLISRYTKESTTVTYKSLDSYFNELEGPDVECEVTHVHHIIPRCLFENSKVDIADLELPDLNSWESGNLIRLSVEKHIRVHQLLWECSRVIKLFYAYNRVLSFNYEYLVNEDKLNFIKIRKRAFVKNMTSPSAMEKKRRTKITKSGNAMGFKRTKDVVEKFKKTLIDRDGSVNAHRHTEEVRAKIAANHNGDADWQLHTEEARLKMAKAKATPIYKVSESGEILAEYWGCSEACRVEGIPSGSLKSRVRNQALYRGYYWIRTSEFEKFIQRLTSTTSL